MKFQPIPQTTVKCDTGKPWAPEICQECYYRPNTHPKSTCQISECYRCLHRKNCVSFLSFLCRLWIFQVIYLIWANTGQLSSETYIKKQKNACICPSPITGIPKQHNCRFQRVMPWHIPVSSTLLWNKTSNFTKNMRDLLNVENLFYN